MTHIETLAVHAGREIEPGTGAVTLSTMLVTIFEQFVGNVQAHILCWP